jgi:hypothetical protein
MTALARIWKKKSIPDIIMLGEEDGSPESRLQAKQAVDQESDQIPQTTPNPTERMTHASYAVYMEKVVTRTHKSPYRRLHNRHSITNSSLLLVL